MVPPLAALDIGGDATVEIRVTADDFQLRSQLTLDVEFETLVANRPRHLGKTERRGPGDGERERMLFLTMSKYAAVAVRRSSRSETLAPPSHCLAVSEAVVGDWRRNHLRNRSPRRSFHKDSVAEAVAIVMQHEASPHQLLLTNRHSHNLGIYP